MHLSEKTKDSRTVYDGKIFTVKSDTVILEDGTEAPREYIVHHGGVCVLPVTSDGEIILVKQYRYPLAAATLEVPAGKLNSVNEDHLEAGKRELLEETGASAKKIQYLGEIYPIPAYTTEIIHMYLAEDLSFGSQNLDSDEFLDVVKMPFEKAVSMVMNNEIKDSKTQIIIMKAWMMKKDI